MIEFNKVNKWFDKYHALVDINETIPRGKVVVGCGPSGSGKSTTAAASTRCARA